MPENRIDATLVAADQQAVLAALQTIREKLPFLIDLSPEERRVLPKMGDKSRAFVEKALEVATQHADILPRAFDIAAMQRDVALLQMLEPIALAVAQRSELVDDTQVAVGSEAYVAALTVYQYARHSPYGQGLDAVADQLGRRFIRRAAPAAPPPGETT
jgi:hypothetical protein